MPPTSDGSTATKRRRVGVHWAAHRATGVVLTVLRLLLRLKIRVSGLEHLVARPTIFMPNHFTRFETLLIPYVLWQHARRQVRILAMARLFRGPLGRYLEALGVLSTRDPRRNRMIVGELMTCANDWVIFPEGRLVKTKKMLHQGRLWVRSPERQGPPHTGGAMLALKAQLCKAGFRDAHRQEDLRRIEYYEECFSLFGAELVCLDDIAVTPVTVTFYPMRPDRNVLSRLVKLFDHDLDPRLEEELHVEGSFLLRGTEVCVHFGKAIEVAEHARRMTALAERFTRSRGPATRRDVFLRHAARRLTDACVRRIYENVEVNFDHLFCSGLRSCRRETIPVDDLRRALYLAARDLAGRRGIRLHPSATRRIDALARGRPFAPWDSIVRLARREGVITLRDGSFVIDRAALDADHDFHAVRMRAMCRVIANELEPLPAAVAAIRRRVNMPGCELAALVSSLGRP